MFYYQRQLNKDTPLIKDEKMADKQEKIGQLVCFNNYIKEHALMEYHKEDYIIDPTEHSYWPV